MSTKTQTGKSATPATAPEVVAGAAKNAAVVAAKRHRRTAAEVAIVKQAQAQERAAKALARAERLEKRAKEAKENAKLKEKAAEATQKAITSPKPEKTAAQKAATGISPTQATKITREVDQALDAIGKKYNVSLKPEEVEVTKRGLLRMKFRGVAALKHAAAGVVGATREAVKFLANAKVLGVSPKLLNKKVTVSGTVYRVVGMKGRANEIVLASEESKDSITMSVDAFKTALAATK